MFKREDKFAKYRREDLNLHAHYGHMDLNHARLPIPPLRLAHQLYHAKIRAVLQEGLKV